MGRKTTWPPTIRNDGVSEYIRWTDAAGRHWLTLGPVGSEAARQEYRRVVAEMEAAGRRAVELRAGATVAEVVRDHLRWARGYHCDKQFQRVRRALQPAVDLYGGTAAAEFGPVAYSTCIAALVRDGLARTYINSLGWCLYGCWRWAASVELVPASVPAALLTVPGLRKGHTEAPESPPVRPAVLEDVRATLPFLSSPVRGLVRFQLATGARPGEAMALRPCDLDRRYLEVDGKAVWLYRLDKHKGDWRGHLRWIPVGPQGQAALAPFLDRATESYCFSPREAKAEWYASQGRQPPQRYRSRPPRERYSGWSYSHAVLRGCERAGVRPWAPNQLRHLVGTLVQTARSQEDARVVLGHRTPTVTARYAEQVERAARVLAELG